MSASRQWAVSCLKWRIAIAPNRPSLAGEAVPTVLAAQSRGTSACQIFYESGSDCGSSISARSSSARDGMVCAYEPRSEPSCLTFNVVPVPEKKPISGTGTTTNSDGRRRRGNGHRRFPGQPDRSKRRWRTRADHDRAAQAWGAVLAELARAVEHNLATPDHAPATERANAYDWADFAAFCGRHGLAPLPAAFRKTLAPNRKPWRPAEPGRQLVSARDPSGSPSPTLRPRLAAIASRHMTAGRRDSSRQFITRNVYVLMRTIPDANNHQ